MFSGHYYGTIDGKHRSAIPAAYRDALGEDFTISINSQLSALALYPKAEWDRMMQAFARIPSTDEDGMNYVRYIMAFSFIDQNFDKQGRFLIPQSVRSFVGNEENCVYVGAVNALEIWEPKTFDAAFAETRQKFAKLTAYVNNHYFNKSED